MNPDEQAQNTYEDYIEQLLKHSEEPIALERKVSLKYLASSFKAAIKKYPTIRLPVPRQKRVLKNTKIISLIERSPQHLKKQERQPANEMSVSKMQWETETKVINKPKIADLCALSPKKYIETFQLNLKFMREQNETYLRGKDNQIKQKIKNKHKKVNTQPIAYLQPQKPQMKEQISKPSLRSRIASKYDHMLEEKRIRKSISISRCYPLARSIGQTTTSEDNQLLKTDLSVEIQPEQDIEPIDSEQRQSIGRSIDSLRNNESEGPIAVAKTTPKRKVQCHKIFINQLKQFKNISRINHTTISTELSVFKHKKSLSIDSRQQKACEKSQHLPHFSFRSQNQPEILDPILLNSRQKDNSFIKHSLFRRLCKDRDLYGCRQRKSTVRNLTRSDQEQIRRIICQDENSCLATFQKKRVIFSNKNICKGLSRVSDQHCILGQEHQN